MLQGGEIDLRIATKAQLAPTTLMAIVELLTQCLPGGDIREPQVSSRETTQSRGTGSHHAYRATHDQGGRCALAPSDAPLDLTGGAKVLFEIIVGARQVFDLLVLEESVPITLSDFAEVGYCRSERPQPVLLLFHAFQQLLIRLLEAAHIALLSVSEQMSGLMHPRIGLPDGRPERLCRR